MTKPGDPCNKCNVARTPGAGSMVLEEDPKYCDYWRCWSCGEIVEDPGLAKSLPSDGQKFARSYRR